MAIDNKYGRVHLERGTIGDDEPVVVFRAQDGMLPYLLTSYRTLCELADSPARHLDGIDAARERVVAWQRENYSQTPQSDPGSRS